MKNLHDAVNRFFNLNGRTPQPEFLDTTNQEAFNNDWAAVASDFPKI